MSHRIGKLSLLAVTASLSLTSWSRVSAKTGEAAVTDVPVRATRAAVLDLPLELVPSATSPRDSVAVAISPHASLRTVYGHVDGQPAECFLHHLLLSDLRDEHFCLSWAGARRDCRTDDQVDYHNHRALERAFGTDPSTSTRCCIRSPGSWNEQSPRLLRITRIMLLLRMTTSAITRATSEICSSCGTLSLEQHISPAAIPKPTESLIIWVIPGMLRCFGRSSSQMCPAASSRPMALWCERMTVACPRTRKISSRFQSRSPLLETEHSFNARL